MPPGCNAPTSLSQATAASSVLSKGVSHRCSLAAPKLLQPSFFQLLAVGAEVWDAREEERTNSGASQQESFRVIHGDLILVIASPPGFGQLGVRATASFARACHFQFPSASLSAKLRPIPAISFSLDGCRDAIFIGLTGNCWHITGLRNVIVF